MRCVPQYKELVKTHDASAAIFWSRQHCDIRINTQFKLILNIETRYTLPALLHQSRSPAWVLQLQTGGVHCHMTMGSFVEVLLRRRRHPAAFGSGD